MNLNKNVVFVTTVAAIILLFFNPFATNNGNFKQVNVTGECIKKVAKDRVSVTVEVKNLDTKVAGATKKSMDTYKKITDAIVVMKSDYKNIEMETTSIDSYEKREWDGKQKKNVLMGYESVIRLEIIAENQEAIGRVIEMVSKYSDVYTGSLRMFTSRELMKAEQESCMKEATANAREKAVALARGGKSYVGKMINANYYNSSSNSGYAEPRMLMAKSVMADMVVAEEAAPTLYARDGDISVTVNASFELK